MRRMNTPWKTSKRGPCCRTDKGQSNPPEGHAGRNMVSDEARVGQKNKITRRWARRGTRPSAPKDQRRKSAYIFGAIGPEHGKGRRALPHASAPSSGADSTSDRGTFRGGRSAARNIIRTIVRCRHCGAPLSSPAGAGRLVAYNGAYRGDAYAPSRFGPLRQRFERVHQSPALSAIIGTAKGMFAPLVGLGEFR